VGISNNNFSKLDYSKISISADFSYEVIIDDTVLFTSQANIPTTVKFNDPFNDNYLIENAGKTYTVKSSKKIIITTNNQGLLYVIGLNRSGKQAKYRGDFEISMSNLCPRSGNASVNLTNVIDLDLYLKGVVPNEMPVYFGLEALKAQAIAARNYVYRPRARTYNNFDVCDSVQSQVYFGANTEQLLSNKAVDETKGLFSLYEDEVILALYSSTAGGFTESYENAFSDITDNKFPARPIPYLTGKPDYCLSKNLSNEVNTYEFYSSKNRSFDENSPSFRWEKNWTKTELEETLAKNLLKYSNTGFITPAFSSNDQFGKLTDIKVLKRGISGKAMYVKISTTTGEWTIAKELVIRRVFQNKSLILPSANVIFQLCPDETGNFYSIKAIGGGLGHGVGMSQYGAGYMAKNGYKFDEILQHYYSGVSIGTLPVDINLQKGETYEKEFYSLNGKATLIVKNMPENMDLMADINSYKVCLFDFAQENKEIRIPIDNFIARGENKIKIYSSSQKIFSNDDSKTKLWIEVYKGKN
jgi:stage II sporulation protein D